MAQRTTATWELTQPERIDATRHGNVNWSEAAKFSEERLKTLQNASQTLKQEEEAFIKRERDFLENSTRFLETFTKANQDFINQEQANIRKINEEIEAKRPELEKTNALIEETRTVLRDIEGRIIQATEQQKTLTNRRKEIAETINPAELGEIKFKDFIDESNNIFKWVLQAIYKESKEKYAWKDFKKQAFKADKGKDFLLRIKGVSIPKLRKDDFLFGKAIVEKRTEYLADLEPKGKENPSLRRLLDYIASIVDIGASHDQVEADKLQLEEQQKELEKKLADQQRITNVVSTLEEKVAASTYYIETLTRLRPLFQNCLGQTQDRIALQNNYLDSIRGNLDAVDAMTQSIQSKPVDRQTYEPTIEQRQNVPYETVKEGQVPEEEENFTGEQAKSQTHPKKVEARTPIPATDLKESEFANSKKGSCESCGIF
jgi:DNA repair exonuclease SbcCD ATPase subunit